MQRRLAAILSADVVGYARLMNRDEAGTLAALKACEAELVEPVIARHHGRIFKRMGDGFLAEFASAVDLVQCAIAWQEAAGARKGAALRFRIGASMGEVLDEDGDLYGDEVNIAARLEAIAQPGCVAVAESVWTQVRDRLDVTFHDLGEQEIRSIERPVRVREWRGALCLPPRLRAPTPAEPEKPSITVMPVRNLSGDEAQDALAEGLRIDLQNALTQVSGVFLIAHATASALEGAPAAQVSASTGVRYVLQSSLRTAGNRVRVAAELIDGIDDRLVWSERYDRTLDDAFALQDEITERVLSAINVTLVAGEQARLWHRTLRPMKALALFYKGVHAFLAMERDDIVRARQIFARVTEMCPDASAGPTWIALAHWVDVQRGWTDDVEQSKRLAREHAEAADRMEYSDGQAQTVLSHVYLMDGEHEAALAAGRRAVTNRPSCANANGFYANVLHYCGEHDEAIRHMDLALRFQPLHPPFFRTVLAGSRLARGEAACAAEIARKTLEIAPRDIVARLILIGAEMREGETGAARDRAAELLAIDPDFDVGRFFERQCYRDRAFVEALAADLRAAGLPG